LRIRELTKQTGITERQVRYLISEGFLPAPEGGRAQAEYGDDHVHAVRRYQRLKELGFPPAAIRLLLGSRDGVPLPLADGITLVVAADRLGSGDPVEPLLAAARTILTKALHPGEPGNDDSND
jgi:MerR family transcriptional regulator, copper efflux regulator